MKYFLPHIIIVLLMDCFSGALLAQTKIAMPAARVEFNELGKKSQKSKFKKLRIKDKLSTKDLREIKRVIRKNSKLSKGEMAKYSIAIAALDKGEREEFKKNLDQVIAADAPELDKYRKRIKRSGKQYADIKHVDLSKREVKDSVLTSYKSKAKEVVGEKLLNEAEFERYRDLAPLDSSLLVLPSIALSDPALIRDSIELLTSESFQNVEKDERLRAFLEQFLSDRINLQNESLISPTNALTSPVVQYVSTLEKFDFQKPEIPDEKLVEAMVEQAKQKKIQEAKDMLTLKDNEAIEEPKFVDRWSIGGYMQYSPSPKGIELTPAITYGLTRRFSIGVGYNTVIPLENQETARKLRGYRLFGDLMVFASYFLHVESEWLQERSGQEALKKSERNTYLGLGKVFQFRKVKTTMLMLYNFNAPNSIQAKQFSLRFGINFQP